jgi:hypothetical protein
MTGFIFSKHPDRSPPFNMQKTYLLVPLAGALLICGCNQQAKINSEKIDFLSQKIIQLEQIQTNQVAMLESQLTSLAPTLDKINHSYFERSHDDALFFHTNNLFLLLTIGKQIEAQLQAADSERQAHNSRTLADSTNQLAALYRGTTQIQDALTRQENRIVDNLNTETRQANAALSNALMLALSDGFSTQNKALAPDATETARRRQLEAAVAQIQRDLDLIKTRLAATTPPATQP